MICFTCNQETDNPCDSRGVARLRQCPKAAKAEKPDVRFYMVTNYGRTRVRANSEADALAAARQLAAKYRYSEWRLMREIRELVEEHL